MMPPSTPILWHYNDNINNITLTHTTSTACLAVTAHFFDVSPGVQNAVYLGLGEDYADMGGGHDWVDGGGRDGSIYSGQGMDTLLGGDGEDRLFGSSDHDLLVGGEARDHL